VKIECNLPVPYINHMQTQAGPRPQSFLTVSGFRTPSIALRLCYNIS